MIEAIQTFQKGKAPSATTLKGLGLFAPPSAFVWNDTPFRVFIQTAMTLIEAPDMTCNLCHVDRSRSRTKLRLTQASHGPIKDRATWNAAP
jgi:hypothetical protein